jgi:hypothetical protein
LNVELCGDFFQVIKSFSIDLQQYGTCSAQFDLLEIQLQLPRFCLHPHRNSQALDPRQHFIP